MFLQLSGDAAESHPHQTLVATWCLHASCHPSCYPTHLALMQARPVQKVRHMWWDLQRVKTHCWSQKKLHMLCRTANFSRCLMLMATASSLTRSTFYWSPFCPSQLRWAMLTACILDQQHFAFWSLPLLSQALQLQLPVCIAHGTHCGTVTCQTSRGVTWVTGWQALTWQHVQHQYLTLICYSYPNTNKTFGGIQKSLWKTYFFLVSCDVTPKT